MYEQMEDEIIWRWSRDGRYSVRTAYHALMEEREQRNNLWVDGDWRKLWQIQVPPKMRHLLWRVARDVIPTRSALVSRGIPGVDDLCGLCGNGSESSKHVFLECEVAINCWRAAGAEGLLPQANQNFESWREWCLSVLNTRSKQEHGSMAAVTWGLWKERNDRVWNQTRKPVSLIVQRAMEAVEEWEQMRRVESNAGSSRASGCVRWHKPPATYVKVNCDAALDQQAHIHGIGIVIRDEDGVLIGYKMVRRNGCPTVKECEAEAVIVALEWTEELGMRRAVIETDSQIVQIAMEKGKRDLTEFGELIDKGKSLLRDQPRKSMVFVRRQGNTTAHVLARRALFSSETVIGSESPDWLRDTLMDVCLTRH